MTEDTIAAIATPIGEGGLAVVRISGPNALGLADRCFVPAGAGGGKPSAARTHTLHYGHILQDGSVVDEVLLAVMRAPRTLTREDVVEITCHGGLLPAKEILKTFVGLGARIAEPGEFTRRAFLNGRIDLAQAEAVIDLIHARTELAMRAANEQLSGKLSQRINVLRDQVLDALAHVEAHIDFPDEDIAPDTREELEHRLRSGITFIDQLMSTADEGRILRNGIRCAIIGRPNAGKSSLLNQLLGRDRAIVSSIPGTTRDTIEETANIRGMPVVFVDTAGLRESRDEIEAEGIRRSIESCRQAELILHVLDASQPWSPAEAIFLSESSARKRLLVLNKTDLPKALAVPPGMNDTLVEVSCRTGEGIERLKDAIKELVWSGKIETGMLEVLINARHQEALQRSRAALVRSADSLAAGDTLELPAMELRIAVNAIGEIVGKTATEDLLDRIFSRFCIGK